MKNWLRGLIGAILFLLVAGLALAAYYNPNVARCVLNSSCTGAAACDPSACPLGKMAPGTTTGAGGPCKPGCCPKRPGCCSKLAGKQAQSIQGAPAWQGCPGMASAPAQADASASTGQSQTPQTK